MRYEYSGYLKDVLKAPDAALRDSLDHVEFDADALSRWPLSDDPRDLEWKSIPANAERTPDGVVLEGRFEEVRRIDHVAEDDPSFWVAMSAPPGGEGRFPIDTGRYPIAEITYRCKTTRARPAWQWTYPGGQHFDGLQPTREWRRIARLIPHFGFPSQIDSLTIRLYATTRDTHAMEIQSIRFRAASPAEAEAIQQQHATLGAAGPAPRYASLEEFFPLGVVMKAATAKALAETMDIGLRDYWRLAFEDIARHHHNCIALEQVELLSGTEWRELLSLAEHFGLRVLAMFDWPMEHFDEHGPKLIDTHIRPHADSPVIMGWVVCNEPPEHAFKAHLEARRLIAEAAPSQPLAAIVRDPNAFPLYAPFLAAMGMSYYKSHAAWQLGTMVRTHLPLSRGRQLWVSTPAFVYATDTPEWNTCPEVRLLLNQAFSNGARGWFGFSYHNDPVWAGGHFQRSLTGPFLTFSDQWAELGHRVERFNALSPLLLHAAPGPPPDFPIEITWREHRGAQRPADVPPIEVHYLHGPDFLLLYVLSNDIGEVTSLHFRVPEGVASDLQLYDMTDFVRSRQWQPMERERHIEMFPGQGQIILIGQAKACEQWRDRVAVKMLEDDCRVIKLDLSLARGNGLALPGVQNLVREFQTTRPMDDLGKTLEARQYLLNSIYAEPAIQATRSQLIRASALICACDGTLCRLLGMGKSDSARELGLRLLPLTRQMNHLRLDLRRGRGGDIHADATRCADEIHRLMNDVRALV